MEDTTPLNLNAKKKKKTRGFKGGKKRLFSKREPSDTMFALQLAPQTCPCLHGGRSGLAMNGALSGLGAGPLRKVYKQADRGRPALTGAFRHFPKPPADTRKKGRKQGGGGVGGGLEIRSRTATPNHSPPFSRRNNKTRSVRGQSDNSELHCSRRVNSPFSPSRPLQR